LGSVAEQRFSVDVPGSSAISIIATTTEALAGLTLIYAPGAGSNLNDPFGAFLASRLPEHGIGVWRFQFPYMEAHRGGPDRPPVLEAAWRTVLAEARERGARRIVAGGRSMGGRIASQVVAAGEDVTALALFAYPLHPPGRPTQRRDSHLPSISVPALFVSGTRDDFGTPAELSEAVALVPMGRLHVLDGADHGYKVLKASGRSQQDVWEDALAAFLSFAGELA
jgi:predicted alpha/beta-hydrolase family hydrolase